MPDRILTSHAGSLPRPAGMVRATVNASRGTHPDPVGPAEVAPPARRRIRVAEVPPEGYAPTLRLARVLHHGTHPAGVLAP